jgi:hypothetical protein
MRLATFTDQKMTLIDFAPVRHVRTLATSVAAVLTAFAAAVIALAVSWSTATVAAPNCLTQPNLKAADGRHWYYRTDRANNRKCWYVKPRNESVGQAATKERPAAKPSLQPPPKQHESLNTIWNRLFPDLPPTEPAPEVKDAQAYHPVAAAQAPTHDRNTDDHAGASDLPPISAAFTEVEPPAARAVEWLTFALIAGAILLVALAAGAAWKYWHGLLAGYAWIAGRVAADRRADYLTVLSRAIAKTDADDRDSRREIYACARHVLVDKLRAADPPLGEARMMAEEAALDAAIAQIEAQRTPKSWPRTPRFGSGGTRSSARRRLTEIATWPLRAGRPA